MIHLCVLTFIHSDITTTTVLSVGSRIALQTTTHEVIDPHHEEPVPHHHVPIHMLRQQTVAARGAQVIEEEVGPVMQRGQDLHPGHIHLEEIRVQDHPYLGFDDTLDPLWAARGLPLPLDEMLHLIVGLVRLFQLDVTTPLQGTHDLDSQMRTTIVPERDHLLRRDALNMFRAFPLRFLLDAPHLLSTQTG